MLNIKERESLNEVYVCGVLKDLNIEVVVCRRD